MVDELVALCTTEGCGKPRYRSSSGKQYTKCIECRRAQQRAWYNNHAPALAVVPAAPRDMMDTTPRIRARTEAQDDDPAWPVVAKMSVWADNAAQLVESGAVTALRVSADLPTGVTLDFGARKTG